MACALLITDCWSKLILTAALIAAIDVKNFRLLMILDRENSKFHGSRYVWKDKNLLAQIRSPQVGDVRFFTIYDEQGIISKFDPNLFMNNLKDLGSQIYK